MQGHDVGGAEQVCFADEARPCGVGLFSGVKLGLHAITSISNAHATRATPLPIRPKPTIPSVLPSRSPPTATCQPPARIDVVSAGIWRMAARNQRPGQFRCAIPRAAGVAHGQMYCSRAASRSSEALRPPVERITATHGNAASRARGRGVRSRITQTTSNGCNAQ